MYTKAKIKRGGNKMTATEMKEMVMKIYKETAWEHDGDYHEVGIRFENKEREIGEICENSKNNYDREDEREFPEYGTEEYEEMEEFGGTSAWDLKSFDDWGAPEEFLTKHCYIVAGNYLTDRDAGLDDGEIVIENAKVIAKIF